ncbi:MAG TPA: hypothetical protein VIG06_04365 [Kofleriaceae bacterium]
MSVLLPTVRGWPEIEKALAASLRQDFAEAFEVLVLDGHGAGLDREPRPPVRWLREPGADVFRLRAVGVAAARGDVVLLSEDHCVAPPDWYARTSSAHREKVEPALIGPVRNHSASSRRAVDRANFALTLGSFAPPLESVPEGRLPVPTNLSFKSSILPRETPDSGWLEYDLLARLANAGGLAVADALIEHLQNWKPAAALSVHFHSGRSYGASVRQWAAGRRRMWWRSLPHTPRWLYRLSTPALRPGASGKSPSLADRAWLASLVLANVMGQAAGALTGVGASRTHLV